MRISPYFLSSWRHSSVDMVVASNNRLPAISENWKRSWLIRITTQLRFSGSKRSATALKSKRRAPWTEMNGEEAGRTNLVRAGVGLVLELGG